MLICGSKADIRKRSVSFLRVNPTWPADPSRPLAESSLPESPSARAMDVLLPPPICSRNKPEANFSRLWVKPMGSHLGVGAPPTLEPGIGMFTGVRDFGPWPIFWFSLAWPKKNAPGACPSLGFPAPGRGPAPKWILFCHRPGPQRIVAPVFCFFVFLGEKRGGGQAVHCSSQL